MAMWRTRWVPTDWRWLPGRPVFPLSWPDQHRQSTLIAHPAGIVTAVGDGVPDVSEGDRVVIHHHSPCGECRRCRRGHETLCERFRSTQLDPGGFAERLRVPADLVSELLPLPDGLEPAAATMVEPLACILRSQDRAGLRPGDGLLVVGAGVNGLLQIAATHARAADPAWSRGPEAA